MAGERLQVHLVSWECEPFTARCEGRPGDVRPSRDRDVPVGEIVAALADALASRGAAVSVDLPLHGPIDRTKGGIERDGPSFAVRFGSEFVSVAPWRAELGRNGVRVRLLESDAFFGEPGAAPRASEEHAIAFFARAALQALRTDPRRRPDILHCHAHESVLVPTLLRLHHAEEPFYAPMRTVFTIHGAMAEPARGPLILPLVGLTTDRFHPFGPFEHEGALSLMKAALAHSDAVTALSRGHAANVVRSAVATSLASLNGGRAPEVEGIRVGLDTRSWDPSSDPRLPQNYSADDASGKAECRAALVRDLRLQPLDASEASKPALYAFVSPLTRDAGADVILDALPAIVARGARLVAVGEGEQFLEERLARIARENPGRVVLQDGSDSSLVRRVLAGADACLLPSRRDLVATRAMRALRYGAVPISTLAEGPADVIEDADAAPDGNAFVVTEPTGAALASAITRAAEAFAQPERWARIRRSGMVADWSWSAPAEQYEQLFARLLAHRPH